MMHQLMVDSQSSLYFPRSVVTVLVVITGEMLPSLGKVTHAVWQTAFSAWGSPTQRPAVQRFEEVYPLISGEPFIRSGDLPDILMNSHRKTSQPIP